MDWKKEKLLRQALEVITEAFNDLDFARDPNTVLHNLREFLTENETQIDNMMIGD